MLSKPYSVHGITHVQTYIVVTTISHIPGEQLLTYRLMAFGNMGDDCGTGVAFTRDPATGDNGLFGEFLTNAQGEDVVAGVRTPMHDFAKMEQKFPEALQTVQRSLQNSGRSLQRHAGYGVYCRTW